MMSTYEGSFAFNYTPKLKYYSLAAKEELCDMRYLIWTSIPHYRIMCHITTVETHLYKINSLERNNNRFYVYN